MSTAQSLFDLPTKFDGKTYQPEHDEKRLNSQLDRVKRLMLDGHWRTLEQIKASIGGSESGISARLRDLRKPRFGSYDVQHRRVDGGLYEYRVRANA